MSKFFSSQRGRRFFFIIAFLTLVLVSGLRRYDVGNDTQEYIRFFNSMRKYTTVGNIPSNTVFERGYAVYVWTLSRLSSNPTVFLMVTSAFCIGAVLFFIARFSTDETLSVLLYIFLRPYFFHMNLIRQAMAISLFLIAVTIYLGKETLPRKIAALLLTLLATQFHSSAIFFLLLSLFTIWKKSVITPQNCLKYTVIVSIVGFVGYSAIIMPLVGRFLPKYAHYFTRGNGHDENYNAALFQTLIQFVFLLVGSIYVRKKESDRLSNFAAAAIFFSVVFHVMSMRMEIWERAAINCSIFTGILWTPIFLSRLTIKSNRRIVRTAILICSCLYMIIVCINRPNWNGVVPYRFFWQ